VPTFPVRSVAIAALLALAAGAHARPATTAPKSKAPPFVYGIYPALETICKHLHANPKLAFKETAHRREARGRDALDRLRGD
jgi:hypothetical protein